MKFKNILVPTDFSEDASAALETAIAFAKLFSSKLTLFHAYHLDIPPSYIGFSGEYATTQNILEPIREASEAAIERLVKDVRAQGVDAEGRVTMENSTQAILIEAERAGADLIVMGTRGLTGLKHVVLGSTAERIVRLAPCPVLTVKRQT